MNREYASIPFWSWNDELDAERLIEQIHRMKEQGMGGFIMHARSGLQTDYLSETWMNCIEVCAREAKKLNMEAWIYDENGWPSGFVGGKLLEDDLNRDCYITSRFGVFDENATVSYCLDDTKLVRVADGQRASEYLNLYIRNSASTVDILNPNVVDQFLELTHEAYKERFGARFSDYISGFFTDEPQYYRDKTPYSNMLAGYFQEHYKEDILDGLGLLFVEKEGYRCFRYRYWKAMQELMLRHFAEKLYSWCEDNHVKLTGHYVEEDSLGRQIMCCAGIMPFYEFEHIPGIDWLCKHSKGELSPRQVSSVAAQLGKKQVLTETFGSCGWDVTPSELKRIMGFQCANGINRICQHLVPYSERGIRKYDYPAHYSDINPWVQEEFLTFNNYFTELGSLLGESKQKINVAMLHPIRSAYFDYKRELEREGFGVKELDEALATACRTLSSRGIEYHFLDEILLGKYGFVEGNKIGCGKCVYDYLVLPTLYTMDCTTEKLLHRYIQQGGRVLLLGEKPTYVEASPYSYEYLYGNCTLEDIQQTQPFRVMNYTTDIYTTYRIRDGTQYIYAINASEKQQYQQTYDCGKKICSFTRVNLMDGSQKQVPLTVTLEPGEDALLFFSELEPESEEPMHHYELYMDGAKLSIEENYLPVDFISYSTDGKKYSKPWPCIALFYKLIKERYRGTIYFRYEFKIEDIPKHLQLRLEENGQKNVWVNNVRLTKHQQGDAWYVSEYEIADLVRVGTNICVIEMDWYERDSVYDVLYGENITESLKNCLVYDSELQPMELLGDFGVYPNGGYREGKDSRYIKAESFYIGELPSETRHDITLDGLPFFAGKVTLSKDIYLEDTNIFLCVPGEYQMAVVFVNGVYAGKLLFSKKIDIHSFVKKGVNHIEIEFVISNRNRLGPLHTTNQEDDGVGPWDFGVTDWQEDCTGSFWKQYNLKRFYRVET